MVNGTFVLLCLIYLSHSEQGSGPEEECLEVSKGIFCPLPLIVFRARKSGPRGKCLGLRACRVGPGMASSEAWMASPGN